MTARLRRIFLVLGIGFAVSVGYLLLYPAPSWAVPAACPSTTLDVYLAAGFSCVINDQEYLNFAYDQTLTGATDPGPAASTIQVTPTPDTGMHYRVQSSQVKGGNQRSEIRKKKRRIIGGRLTNSATLGMSGVVVTPTPGNAVILREDLCLGGMPLCPGGTSLLVVSMGATSLTDKSTDTVSFSPTGEIDVATEFDLSATPDTAQLDSFSTTFTEVPEPATLALLGTGLFSLALFRRRGTSKA